MAELMQCESKIIAKGGGDISIVCGNSFGGEGGDDATDDTIGKVNVESFNSADTEVGVRTNHPNQVTGFDSTRDFLRQFVAERNWDQVRKTNFLFTVNNYHSLDPISSLFLL